MTLLDIISTAPQNSENFTVKIGDHPIWDYKEGVNIGEILLISDNPWEGVESEYVTVKELYDFTYTNIETSDDKITFYTEADYEQLNNFIWLQDTLVLSHF